ncbi:MAG: amidohydrolase [Candidatus Bathyarchaeota archaeon]|jgi:5-methylthioadenosine/S-adenosylhomocysteine deaminase|nr:amidohydrolase [Candidatus Bathyarchaeota archaeon A05DMB-3]MDH7607372.1 amidohydrolase [Candidatus Bathyarchaeota archaeon]
MNHLIYGGTIITMQNGKIIKDGAVVIENDVIVDVGKSREMLRKYPRGYERLDAKGKVVIPGLINTHQHAAMSLLRGYADDLPLQEWLEKWIWPIEGHMTANDIYIGALLTAVESILGGTTTLNTMYHYTPNENEAKAFADAGLRGVVGHVCFSWRKKEDINALEDLAKSWHNRADGRIRVSVDPHAPYTVDPEYMKELKELRVELNEKYGLEKAPLIWHVHVAETSDEKEKIRKAFNVEPKGGVMEYLDSLGVLDEHFIAAHCVAVTEGDIAVMKRRGVKVSHNPISNLKLASGVSPVPKMLEQGVTVSLGTDSPCSNNAADMFEVMKTAAILHKGLNKNPTVMAASQVLDMATLGGAKALCWNSEIGSIEVGKKADLAIVNFVKPHLCPIYNEVSHLVYAAKSADVETVIINGRMVMENRRLTTLKIEKIMEMAEKAKTRLLERLKRNVK